MQNMLKRSYSVTKERSQKNTYSGLIAAKQLSRLADSVVEINENAQVSFKIFDGYGELPEIKGQFELTVTLTCQRCLSDFKMDIKNDFHFYISKREVCDDEFDLEVIACEEGDLLNVVALVEDEIILNLPIIPKHETDCNEYLLKASEIPEEVKEIKKNPFDCLKGLKTSLKH